VRQVEGRFEKGDAVVVRDLAGREVGRGLARYDAADAARIVGLAPTPSSRPRLLRRPPDPRRRRRTKAICTSRRQPFADWVSTASCGSFRRKTH
jgi:hypothetical protein